MCFFLGDKYNGSITFKVIWVSKSALAASPAVYSSRIPRANQDKQIPPPRQSTQKPQKKQACGQHQGRHALTRATIHDNARQEREQRLPVWSRECRLSAVPIQTWRPKKRPKVGLAILLGSILSIRLRRSWRQTDWWCPYRACFVAGCEHQVIPWLHR